MMKGCEPPSNSLPGSGKVVHSLREWTTFPDPGSEFAPSVSEETIMGVLRERVAIVTGASRGIGRALALGLARERCSIVVAAKSVEATEKLPGSIYTVAREVEALGAQALPVRTDVRDQGQIEAMVAQARERFG